MHSCQVIRTHSCGVLKPTNDWGKPTLGHVRMFKIRHEGLRREVSVLTLDELLLMGAAKQADIPDLIDPALVTFSSDRGMMAVGFEEIDGQRFYQGWWIQWIDRGPD